MSFPIIRDTPLLLSIHDLRNNLIDPAKLKIEGDFHEYEYDIKYAPKIIYAKFFKLLERHPTLKVGCLPVSDVWYALVGAQIIWSTTPIAIAPYNPLELDYEEKAKNISPKKRFSRFTALLEDD